MNTTIMHREIKIFFTAIMFYTRIPCPSWVGHDAQYMQESARYFTAIGWIVGALSAIVFWIGERLLSVELAILLSMGCSIRLTGAFHEDGFADVCDGFGGGWSKERILEIMKDSRLGTFGVVGLILLLGVKFFALNALAVEQATLFVLGGHILSRMTAARMLRRGAYVQNNNLSKAGSAANRLSLPSLLVNSTLGLLYFTLLPSYLFMWALLPMLLTEWWAFRFFKKWIGGYNGDCAGTVQQLSEIVFYLSSIVLWKFI
ncbi:adenosylcobinamide-GDP ribazoletransferase [Algivirga pacifica]|uniref:Adenosylcobinamide-GDP ribazoletransferase n=1 Tax=Algivirga pacifica TaxID=1162670 RepID=A0ABP9DF32_9BACT